MEERFYYLFISIKATREYQTIEDLKSRSYSLKHYYNKIENTIHNSLHVV